MQMTSKWSGIDLRIFLARNASNMIFMIDCIIPLKAIELRGLLKTLFLLHVLTSESSATWVSKYSASVYYFIIKSTNLAEAKNFC